MWSYGLRNRSDTVELIFGEIFSSFSSLLNLGRSEKFTLVQSVRPGRGPT